MRTQEVGMSTKIKRVTGVAMALILASTVAVNAQRGGGGHGGGGFGGGHMGGGFGGGHMGGGGFRGGHAGGGFSGQHAGHRFDGRHGFDGRGRFDGRHRFGGSRFFFGAGFYDPFYYPYYYPYGLFPFAYYPYSAYAYGLALDSNVKVKATPKQAQVFVDGYYAGVSDDFDGAFQRLHVTPGGHVITLYLDGYRTLSRSIYARPGSTVTFADRLEPLAPGEASAPPAGPVSPTIPPVQPQAPPDESGQ
jgi:PEGA domain